MPQGDSLFHFIGEKCGLAVSDLDVDLGVDLDADPHR
jgi:hypothetical protein